MKKSSDVDFTLIYSDNFKTITQQRELELQIANVNYINSGVLTRVVEN